MLRKLKRFIQFNLKGISVVYPTQVPLPITIHIETMNGCNLNCVMCNKGVRDRLGMKRGRLSFSDFRKIINQFPHLKFCNLHGMGEPLLNEDIFKIVKILRKRNIEASFSTNATLINETMARKIIHSGLNHIFISFDGAFAETYEKIRVGAKFEKVIRNIKTLVEAKRNLKDNSLLIRMVFDMSKDNIEELPMFVELIHSIGVKDILINRVHDWNKDDFEKISFTQDLAYIDSILEEAEAKAKKYSITLQWHGSPIRKINPLKYICFWPWSSCYIAADGYVTPCCMIGDPRVFNFGNLFDSNIKSIWNSKKYQTFRRKSASKNKPDVCKNCQYIYECQIKVQE